ncbi:hypothetical protein KFE94_17665 [bacterium SCSIO 12643]|nr:hypothetical protein KFE94_17665 [bacterium SCSIO 12643]
MNDSNQLTREKMMLAMAFLADAESGKHVKLNRYKTETECCKLMNMAFQEKAISEKIGNWTCLKVWILGSSEEEARNTTMIFENEAKTELIIGVAGTNFINRYDWFTEDVETETLVPWNNGIIHRLNLDTHHDKGYIATGTSIALKNTWNLRDKKMIGVKLDHWLKEYLSETPTIKTVSVTGHSLGGAISPVLAQALSDHQNLWSSNPEIQIESYIYAGPTPGDTNFVTFMENGDVDIHSVYNKNDVVPHAWNPEMITQIYGLFEPYLPNAKTRYGAIVNAVIDWIKGKSKKALTDGHLYQRWSVEQTFEASIPVQEIPHKAVQGFVDVLMLDLEADKESRESLCRICAIPAVDKQVQIVELMPYLEYLAKFLMVLGGEHVQAYFNYIGDEIFVNKLREYLKGGTMQIFGIQVLNKLFKEIGSAQTVSEID